MMSPMSVAQYLAPGKLPFDIVVFDEASQVPPEDALGAIVRGKQLIVVGDQKQLPPTPFFQKIDSRDEEADDDVVDVGDQESALDLALGCFQPVRCLTWHYRSQHESLIAFSNRRFYLDKLVIFPSPHHLHSEYGVKLCEVEGVYNAHVNHVEAEAIVTAALELMAKQADCSLGVVAMNQPQRDLISDMMDTAFASDPAAEVYRAKWSSGLYPFFVKNLENVQGDERDVIFISTVTARTPLAISISGSAH
jgi:superfamily I DNA and/or RNA helicase